MRRITVVAAIMAVAASALSGCVPPIDGAQGVPTEALVDNAYRVRGEHGKCTLEFGGKLKLLEVAPRDQYRVKLEVPGDLGGRKLVNRNGMCADGSTFSIDSAVYAKMLRDYPRVESTYLSQMNAATRYLGLVAKDFKPTGEVAKVEFDSSSSRTARIMSPKSTANIKTAYGFWSTCEIHSGQPVKHGQVVTVQMPVVGTYTSPGDRPKTHQIVTYKSPNPKPVSDECPVGVAFLADAPYGSPNMDRYEP